MNDLLDGHHDQKLDGNLGVNLCPRMNDRLDDLNLGDDRRDALDGHHKNVMDDLNLDVTMDVNLCHRMNDLLAGHSMDASHVNRNYVLPDQKMDGNLGVSLCHRMNDPLDGHLMGVNRVNRNYARHDLNLVVMMDGNLYHRKSDLLVGHSMDDDHHDVLVDHRMNATDDRKMDGNLGVNHVNRNCVRHDRNLDVTMVVKNLHVK
jgi:hypothetical protein